MFYLDFIGNAKDNNVKQLLDELGKHVRFIRVLGCYQSKDVSENCISSFKNKPQTIYMLSTLFSS